MEKEYLGLSDIPMYRLSPNASKEAWKIYKRLDWQDKKNMRDQFIRSVDSVGANIAEGYGRFHYLDRIKFYYNARGSLLEAKHWTYLLYTRVKISEDEYWDLIKKLNEINRQINTYIKVCRSIKK